MIKNKNIFIYLGMCLGVVTCAPIVEGRDDLQYWSEYNVKYKISDRLSLILNPSFRMKEDISQKHYWESRQGLSYKLNEALSINGHYRHAETKNDRNQWIDENVFEFQPTYAWAWESLDFANRFRIEYRIVNGVEKWRYRNQIKVGKQVTLLGWPLTTYVSDELFYDEAVDQMNQHRVRIGVNKKISKVATVGVFYQNKSNAIKQDWYSENILGTSVELSF